MRKKIKTTSPNPSRIHSSPDYGLTDEQVRMRILEGHTNYQPPSNSKPIHKILSDNICTLFNMLNLFLGILVFLVGEYRNMFFLLIAFLNTVIATTQEIRSKLAVDRLSVLTSTTAMVMREGKQTEISVNDIVLDDVIMLVSGRQISADSVVLEGRIEVNEALLTGESNPVVKTAGDMLLSGSFVVSGRCSARVEHVGKDNYANSILASARKFKQMGSEILRSLKILFKLISTFMLPFAALIFIKHYFIMNLPINAAVLSMVASLIGMIPSGLVLLTSSALALGVIKLSRGRTLVQDIYCIETLARVDVLCLDKTGTITDNCQQVVSFSPLWDDEAHALSVMQKIAFSSTATNSTTQALKSYFTAKDNLPCDENMPFSSERKYSAYTIEGRAYYVGAPEILMGDAYHTIQSEVEVHTLSSLRVILLAVKDTYTEELDGLTPLALIALAGRIREDAPATIAYFYEQGVDVKIISGDNPQTVAEVSRRAGVKNADNYIDSREIKTKEDAKAAALKYTVFGRVTPNQKQWLIEAMQQEGHTVAMVGDGVNDILALKTADCSIAMASGSEAVRYIAQMVLLDSNFSALPGIVLEGRRVINNVGRSAMLFLVKTLYSFLLTLLFIILPLKYPFIPIQLSLISTLTIGIPGFFLTFEPNTKKVEKDFVLKVIKSSAAYSLTVVINVIMCVLLGNLFSLTPKEISASALILTGVTSFIVLFQVCRPFTLMRKIMFPVLVFLFTLCIFAFSGAFMINPYDVNLLLFSVPLSLLTPFTIKLMQQFMVFLQSRNMPAWLRRIINIK